MVLINLLGISASENSWHSHSPQSIFAFSLRKLKQSLVEPLGVSLREFGLSEPLKANTCTNESRGTHSGKAVCQNSFIEE